MSDDNWASVIESWPTAAAFARDLGVKDGTARAWKRRGIPAEFWLVVVEAAARHGRVDVTLDRLAGLARRVAA